MKTLQPQVSQVAYGCSSCRHCRHYTPDGRRGGSCQQLGVPVQSDWKACPLAVAVFSPPWDGLEELLVKHYPQPDIHPEPVLSERAACVSVSLEG